MQPLQQVDEDLEQQVDYALVLHVVSHVEEHDVYNVQQGDAGQVQQVERQVLPIEYNVQVQVDEEQVLSVLSMSLHQLAQGLIWN